MALPTASVSFNSSNSIYIDQDYTISNPPSLASQNDANDALETINNLQQQWKQYHNTQLKVKNDAMTILSRMSKLEGSYCIIAYDIFMLSILVTTYLLIAPGAHEMRILFILAISILGTVGLGCGVVEGSEIYKTSKLENFKDLCPDIKTLMKLSRTIHHNIQERLNNQAKEALDKIVSPSTLLLNTVKSYTHNQPKIPIEYINSAMILMQNTQETLQCFPNYLDESSQSLSKLRENFLSLYALLSLSLPENSLKEQFNNAFVTVLRIFPHSSAITSKVSISSN